MSAAGPEEGQMTPVIEARGISKRFGHVVALDGVDLTLAPGEHCERRIVRPRSVGDEHLHD